MKHAITEVRGGYLVVQMVDDDYGNGGGGQPADEFPIENQDDIGSYGIQSVMTAITQSITGKGGKLQKVTVSLRAVSNPPPANIVVNIYAATVGTVGLNAKPAEGSSPLATSDLVPVSAISGGADGGLVDFTFSGANQIDLTAGTAFCIAVEKEDHLPFPLATPQPKVNGGLSWSGGHYGNCGYKQNTWGSDPGADMIFYLYTA